MIFESSSSYLNRITVVLVTPSPQFIIPPLAIYLIQLVIDRRGRMYLIFSSHELAFQCVGAFSQISNDISLCVEYALAVIEIQPKLCVNFSI